MKFLPSLLIFFVASTEANASEPYHPTHERKPAPRDRTAYMKECRSYMDFIVFPEVALSKVSLSEAIDWVWKEAPKHVPASVPADRPYGLSIVLRPPPGPAKTISIFLRQATLPQVLDAICAEHDYVWSLEPYALTIVPRSEELPDKSALPNAKKGVPVAK